MVRSLDNSTLREDRDKDADPFDSGFDLAYVNQHVKNNCISTILTDIRIIKARADWSIHSYKSR